MQETTSIGLGAEYAFYKNDEFVCKTNNLILDGFFSRLLTSSTNPPFGRYATIYVGSGTNAVSAADTTLQTQVASSGSVNNDASATDMYIYATYGGRVCNGIRWTYTYNSGTFSGQTITEVGARFHNNTSSPNRTDGTLDSRALITDPQNNLLGITLGASDTLTVVTTFYSEIPDMRYHKSPIEIQGQYFEVGIGAIEATNSVSQKHNSILISDSGVSTIDGRWLWAHNFATYPTRVTTYSFIYTGAQTAVAPNSTAWGAGTQRASSAYNRQNATVTSVAQRTATLTYSIYFSSTDLNNTIGGLAIPARAGTNTWEGLAFRFDPPLDNTLALTNGITIAVTFKFGQLTHYNEEPAIDLKPAPQSAAFTETVANGASTTIQKCYAYPQGGVPPYTYSWTYVSGGSALLSADAPTSYNTTFSGTGTSQTSAEVWRCTVTDSSTTPQQITQDYNVTVTWA